MVNKSNYIFMLLIMLAVLILFMFSGVSTSLISKNGENPHAEKILAEEEKEEERTVLFQENEGKKTIYLITGLHGGNTLQTIRQGCSYLKRNCIAVCKITDLSKQQIEDAEMVVIGTQDMDIEKDIPVMQKLLNQKIPLVFAVLPRLREIKKSDELKKMLGIASIREEEQEMNGIKIFEDLLIGGELQYLDWDMEVPYFFLEPGYKVYAVGLLKDQKKLEIKNEELPALIWRNGKNKAPVYVFNAPFLEDSTGIGLFAGIFSEYYGRFLYPVINAQVVMLQNFPYLTSENAQEMNKRYSQNSDQFLQTQIWPGLSATLDHNKDQYSAFICPQLDYETDYRRDNEKLEFYAEEILKKNGEFGISGYSKEVSEEKLLRDMEFYREYLPDYQFTTFSTDGMWEENYREELKPGGLLQEVRTLVKPLAEFETDNFFSYYNEQVVQMPVISNGYLHEEADNLRLHSMETALGVSITSVDMKNVVYPEKEEDDWANLGINFSRYSDTYWKPFRMFDSVLVSEAGERIRRFLNLDYLCYNETDGMRLDIDGLQDEAYFILRTNQEEIVSIENGSYQKIEEDAYLIKAVKQRVKITLKEKVE